MKVKAISLATLAALHGLPGGVVEYRFAPPRRWKFDLAFLVNPQMVAIEIQGGLFIAGRHTRGAALEREYEKHAAATARGWRVLYASTGQLNSGLVWDWVKEVWKGK